MSRSERSPSVGAPGDDSSDGRVWIGVDLGTQGIRAAAYTATGGLVATAQTDRPPRTPAPGALIHDPDRDWWGGIVEALAAMAPSIEGKYVAGIGLAALFPAFCLTDREGAAVTEGFLYADERARTEVERVAELTGRPLRGDEVAPKLRWLRSTRPRSFDHAASVDGPATYVMRRLTGSAALDPHSAVRWGGLAEDGRGWDEEAASRVGIPLTLLPPIRDPISVIGTVTGEAAAATGLAKGTPVIVGATDSFCQLLGDGVSRPGDGLAYYGSTGTLMVVTEHFATALGDRSRFSGSGPYRLAAYLVGLGGFLELVRERILGGRGHAELDAAASTLSPGSDGLFAYPWVAGHLDDGGRPAGSAGFIGLSLQHEAGHVWRAALESFGFVLMSAGDRLEVPLESVVAAGGGSHSAAWLGIVSDQTGWRQRTAAGGGSARGAAFLAALGTGEFAAGTIPDEVWPMDTTTLSVAPDAGRGRHYAQLHRVWASVDRLIQPTSA